MFLFLAYGIQNYTKGRIMPIARNAGSEGGNYIESPGEYRVTVTKTETGHSKSQKKMLTVTFTTRDDKSIRGFYVGRVQFHMKNLEQLKTACGLLPAASADQLVGKECGILVEAQEPDASTGRVYMQITGYGKASDVGTPGDAAEQSNTVHDDDIPF